MTIEENTGIRDLGFSQWVRKNLPDSSTGFMASDLDFILYNYKTKKLALVEIKTRGADLKEWQRKLFKNLDKWLLLGIEEGWEYLGFFLIQFENTSFEDGRVYLNREESTESEIKKVLSLLK